MRVLATAEQRKRGCSYCTQIERVYAPKSGSGKRRACPHKACPYTVLDKYDTYEEYMESEDSRINIAAFVEAVGGAGRLTDSAWVNIPVLRRLGKGPLF